jgi:iron complex outermembrane recepter protein
MSRWAIAVSVGLAMGTAWTAVDAQGADESGDDDVLELLQGEPEASSEPGEAQPADGGEGASAESSGSEAAPSEAQSSENASSEGETAEDASGEDDARAPAPLEVIPVAKPEPPADETPQEPARRQALEEVIVTAQRREESAQDVAISITVFDQEQITKADMTNSADLATYTPSLSSNQRFGPENASFSIRGFTQDLRTTASVATYFAEVVAPRGQQSQTSGDGAGPGTLFDLQNVQVLKGPQGTLFGRNTTGGAVLIVPQKPTDQFEGYVEASGGEFDAQRIQAIVNIPLFDSLKIRLGVDDKKREGHLNNVLNVGADYLGNVNYTAARASVVWNLTESLENYSIFQYVDSDTNGYTTRLFDCNTGFDPEHPSPFALFTQRPCQQQLADQAASGQDGFYDLYSNLATPVTMIEEKRFINTTTWQATDNLAIKNILAYAHLHTENGTNVFGTYFPDPTNPAREFAVGVSVVSPNVPVTSQETWVEELQLQGVAFGDRFIWQAGGYYETSRPDGFSGNNSASFLYCELATLEQPDPSQYNCFDPLAGALGGVLVQEYQVEYLNKAVYAQGTFDFTDRFSTTVGLRYTWDETEGFGMRTLYRYALAAPQAPVDSTTTPMVKSEAPTGMLELNYKPFDGIMTYAKYTRGYRQGSVNLAADPGVDTHEPETVDTYEIGAKTSFGGPVPGRFNFAVFHNELTDMQLQFGYISRAAGPTTSIANAGKAEISGFEAEVFLQPFDTLTLNLSYAYLDTELLEQDQDAQCTRIREQVGQVEGLTCTPIADVGDSLPFASDHSGTASLNYILPLPLTLGEISLGATYAYIGKQRAAATSATPYAVLDDFALLNLNLNWMSLFDFPLDLAVFATNVLDEEYATYISGTYNVLGIETRGMGLPRQIGARLRYNF